MSFLSIHGLRLCPTGFIYSEWVPAKFPHHQLEPQQHRPHVLWVHLPIERHPGQGVVSLTHLIFPCPGYFSYSSNLHLLTDYFNTSLYPNFLSFLGFWKQNHACLPHSQMSKVRLRNGSSVPKLTQWVGGRARIWTQFSLAPRPVFFHWLQWLSPAPRDLSLTHSSSPSF